DRENYPDFDNIGTFTIYQYFGRYAKRSFPGISFEILKPSDEVLGFINSYYINYELGPCITLKSLEGAHLTGVYQDGKLKAIFGIDNLDEVKQNVVLKIPLFLRLFKGFMNLIRPLTGTVALPGIQQPIRMLYFKFLFLCEPEKNLIQAIFRKVQHEAYQLNYPFISISLHERDPLQKLVPKRWRIPFHSVGMLVSMKNNRDLIAKIQSGVPYKDFSTV
ncbi:MAG: hypothetical protein P8Z38_08595, partial [Robiginitalea sp.]